jgi:hypothetical protein
VGTARFKEKFTDFLFDATLMDEDSEMLLVRQASAYQNDLYWYTMEKFCEQFEPYEGTP